MHSPLMLFTYHNHAHAAFVQDPGRDPVSNYMNYISGRCFEMLGHFTYGQVQRMVAQYEKYRLPKKAAGRGVSGHNAEPTSEVQVGKEEGTKEQQHMQQQASCPGHRVLFRSGGSSVAYPHIRLPEEDSNNENEEEESLVNNSEDVIFFTTGNDENENNECVSEIGSGCEDTSECCAPLRCIEVEIDENELQEEDEEEEALDNVQRGQQQQSSSLLRGRAYATTSASAIHEEADRDDGSVEPEQQQQQQQQLERQRGGVETGLKAAVDAAAAATEPRRRVAGECHLCA